MKKIIRLTESDLVKIVKKTISEINNENKGRINEGIFLTLSGLALGANILKKVFGKKNKNEVNTIMEKTGRVQKGQDGVVMVEYKDKATGKIYWGVDVTDDVDKKNVSVLLFNDNPQNIQSIINSEKNKN